MEKNKKKNIMKYLRKFNESNSWSAIEKEYYDFIERNNNEVDYDQEFDKMKELSKEFINVPWNKVQREYFDFIEMTNNESDDKFEEFKKIVQKYDKGE